MLSVVMVLTRKSGWIWMVTQFGIMGIKNVRTLDCKYLLVTCLALAIKWEILHSGKQVK